MVKLLGSVYEDLDEGCKDEFINKRRGYGYMLTFDQFKDYVFGKFGNEISAENLNDIYYDFKCQLDKPMYTSLDIENNLINHINRG